MLYPEIKSKEIERLSNQISKKILVQIEGPTCSGKTSFAFDLCLGLVEKGINVMCIEEAAAKVLKENRGIIEQLQSDPGSHKWNETKLELQRKVISEQLISLSNFAENNDYVIAIMDRGGASTAYHTIPLLSNEVEKESIQNLCREMAKMAELTLMISSLGFLKRDSLRYQKTINEIGQEAIGIKNYLDGWTIRYLEIPAITRAARLTVGLKYVLYEIMGQNAKQASQSYKT